jgi:opacity protein-like surface antigen
MPPRPRLGLAALALLGCTASSALVHAEPSELPPQFAYNYGETDTPRSAAMGGGLRALGFGTTAPFLNPASMGASRIYHIEALGQFTPEAARQLYGGTIVDSTRRFGGGVSVIGGFQDPDGVDRSHIDVRAALAYAISDKFSIGLTGRYLNLDQEGLGPLGQSRASGGLLDAEDPPSGRQSLVNTITFDAGINVAVTDGLRIGLVGHNLSYPDHGLLPTLVGGGIGYGTEDFSLEIDAIADLNSYEKATPRIMAGAEVLLGDHFPVRGGYRYDNGADSHALSAGTGYIDPRFSIEAAVRRTVAGPSATTIVVSLAYFLESSGLAPIEQPKP